MAIPRSWTCASVLKLPDRTAVISRRHLWFSREMTSEKRTQKDHTINASLPRSGQCFWLVEADFQPIRSTQTQSWVVSHHYGISALVSQSFFCGETNGNVTKCGSAVFLGYDKKETRFLIDQPSTFVAVTIVIFAHLCWIYSIIVEICFTNFRRKFGYCLNGFKFAYRFRKL